MKSVSAHATRPSVTLASGEVLSADVVVGADGYLNGAWFTRTYVMDAHEQEDTKTPTGMQMFRCMCVCFLFLQLAPRALRGVGLCSGGGADFYRGTVRSCQRRTCSSRRRTRSSWRSFASR